MTPAETEYWRSVGVLLMVTIVDISIRCLICGMCILLFFISTIRFLHRGFASHANKVLFVVSIINLFAITTFAIPMVVQLILVNINIQNEVDVPMSTMEAVVAPGYQVLRESAFSIWSSIIPIIITDAIVVWRAWKILQGQVLLIVVLVFLLFSTTGALVVSAGMATEVSPTLLNPSNNFLVSGYGLSLLTNIITTSLISYKLWSFQKFTDEILGPIRIQKSPVEKVLFLLIESGAIYCIFQIGFLIISLYYILNPIHETSVIILRVASDLLTGISAMYPTLVIVIVDTGNSFSNTYDPNIAFSRRMGSLDGTSFRRATPDHLSFAVPSLETTDEIGELPLPRSPIAPTCSIVTSGDLWIEESKGRASPEVGLV